MPGARYPAQIPNGLGEGVHTIDDTDLLPGNTIAIHLRVTTAGYVRVEDEAGQTADIPFDTGTHRFELARMKRVHATGTTAVLDPASKVFPLNNLANA